MYLKSMKNNSSYNTSVVIAVGHYCCTLELYIIICVHKDERKATEVPKKSPMECLRISVGDIFSFKFMYYDQFTNSMRANVCEYAPVSFHIKSYDIHTSLPLKDSH